MIIYCLPSTSPASANLILTYRSESLLVSPTSLGKVHSLNNLIGFSQFKTHFFHILISELKCVYKVSYK